MNTQKIAKRAALILEIAQRMAKKLDKEYATYQASNHIEDIQLHSEYAEPGYSSATGMIATGNWNTFEVNGKECKLAERVSRLFEKLGIECEWSDEWVTCGDCGALVRTQSDSHSWHPHYIVKDGELICYDCDEHLTEDDDVPSDDIAIASLKDCIVGEGGQAYAPLELYKWSDGKFRSEQE